MAVAGSWRYRATADAAAALSSVTWAPITGTLVVSSVNAVRFEGTLTMVETGPDGLASRSGGVVTGRLVDGQVVDFTVTLPGGSRTHVGAFRGDSLSGRWMTIDASGQITSAGRFDAVRD